MRCLHHAPHAEDARLVAQAFAVDRPQDDLGRQRLVRTVSLPLGAGRCRGGPMSLGLSDGQYPGLQRIQAADPMTKHQVGTREQWLAARRALLEREKQLTRRSDDLARERQRLPWVPVDETYTFQTSDGPKTLAELLPGALSCSSTTSCSDP